MTKLTKVVHSGCDEWGYANQLITEVRKDRDGLYEGAILWHQLCHFIRFQENRLLVLPESPAPSNLAAHKAFVEASIDIGKILLTALERQGIELPEPYSTEVLQTMLKKQEFDLRMWHNRKDVSLEESDAFISAAFS